MSMVRSRNCSNIRTSPLPRSGRPHATQSDGVEQAFLQFQPVLDTDLKLSRLFQPRNPLFWLMVVLNLLSSAFSYVLHTYSLTTVGTLVVAGFALSNAVIGIGLALRLMREDPVGGSESG
jgi:hypothetical protein